LEGLVAKHSEAVISVVEVPPGPPVMATLVAEISGQTLTSYDQQRAAAETLAERFKQEPFVTHVDTSVGLESDRLRFVSDKSKAAMSGIPTHDINRTLAVAHQGEVVGYLSTEREANPLPLVLRLPVSERSREGDLASLLVKGRLGAVTEQRSAGLQATAQNLVAVGELGQFESIPVERPIYRKDLRPVVYVTAEISGRTPAEVIADISADQTGGDVEVSDWHKRTFVSSGGTAAWTVPEGIDISWTGEGEWKITVDVFRDMGLAFAFALIAIYFVLRWQTGSMALTFLIMSSIPLTMIGIMPGFWLLNQVGERVIAGSPEPVLFTATAMIGMIALAGIVVRNSLILVDFIDQARKQGATVLDAVLGAGAIRMRPVLLTAGTTLLGNLVITLDPVFSGLAIAIIFGIVASTVLTLVVVPAVYCMLYGSDSIEESSK
jgi:multidrug efflux pump subunit AcrB